MGVIRNDYYKYFNFSKAYVWKSATYSLKNYIDILLIRSMTLQSLDIDPISILLNFINHHPQVAQ